MPDTSWVLTVTVFTHAGAVRAANEDTVGVGEWVSPERMDAPVVVTLPVDVARMAVVADGMGGHAAGARASRSTVQHLLRGTALIADGEALARHLREANQAIYEIGRHEPALAGMGATVAGVLIAPPDSCFIFNVGDSRVYVERGGFLRQLTHDDAWPASGGTFDPLDDAGGGAVTQAIGGQPSFVDVAPHVVEMPLAHGQCFLVCSDGLTNELTLDALEDGLAGSDDRATMHSWFDAAMLAGARDNLSAIVVRVTNAEMAEGS